MRGIAQVGELLESGELFLRKLMLAAQAMEGGWTSPTPRSARARGPESRVVTMSRRSRPRATTNPVGQAASDSQQRVDCAFNAAFLQEHGERPRALSVDEVRDEWRPWNLRGADRYYYEPKEDTVLFGDALDLPHEYPWRLTNQEVVPGIGWAHDDGCDCRSGHGRHHVGPDDWANRSAERGRCAGASRFTPHPVRMVAR